jgi:hypothetical protein
MPAWRESTIARSGPPAPSGAAIKLAPAALIAESGRLGEGPLQIDHLGHGAGAAGAVAARTDPAAISAP